MTLEDGALLCSAVAFWSFAAWQCWAPAWRQPSPQLFGLRGLVGFAATLLLSALFSVLCNGLLEPHRLLDGRGLGIAGGALVGALTLEFVNYWWHRALHGSDLLWHWLHQLHHSVERFDVASSMYFSPLDVVGWSAMRSLALVLVLGLRVEAVLLVNCGLFIVNMFSHCNIRTPRWLGNFIVRPEMHAMHHERGMHTRNYAVLPVWDRLFGTFANPDRFDGQLGFYEGASARVADMLLGFDVTEPPRPPPSVVMVTPPDSQRPDSRHPLRS